MFEKIDFSFPALSEYQSIAEEDREAWLESNHWYQGLPEEDPFQKCRCGRCDGYGNLIIDGRAQRCPAIQGQVMRRSREWFQLEGFVDSWEGWPVPSFAKAKTHPNFKYTLSFKATERLYHLIRNSGEKHGLILCGANGRGKTWSSLILLSECAMVRKKAFAFRFGELIEYLRWGIEGRERVQRIYELIKSSDVILMDEFGREIQSGNRDIVRQAFEFVIDKCYKLRTLIITTNLDQEDLNNYYTSFVVSRLSKQAGYCETILDWDPIDLRGSGVNQ